MQTINSRYQLEQELGAGGMGTVYRGTDSQTGATVAIKKLKPQLGSPELIERFKREGEALRTLKHPNIVQLLDAVEEDGENFLIMEYVSGGDLSQRLEQGALPLREILPLAIDLCDALTRAHRLDIIHRDLKPANILIADDGTVRLSDFGVAHFGSKQRVTQTDSIIGTIDYLAPEVFSSNHVDKRADIWAVGVILFEMLTGQRPFAGTTINQVLNKIVMGEIPDIEELCPNAPTALVDLIYRILNRNPEERIPSIRLVGAELEALLNDSPLTPSSSNAEAIHVIVSAFDTTPVPSTKHNLPRPSTAFVGREEELAAVTTLLREPKNQLVTIIAQGGMGKTRLSIEAAKSFLGQYSHGIYFIELAPLSKAADIPAAIAEAVGYPFNASSSPESQIVDYFREKNCLLVLDNFEHILAGRDLVQALLQNSTSKILVTSRERLNLSGETLYHLEGMDFPNWETPADALQYAAMRLFMESAKRVRPDFSIEADDLPYAARICRLVHGLPLGIVLAASWLDALSLREIGEEIASNIDFLESTMHDLPERQRSIRAVFDYSWTMLSEDEKQAFARLSVFHGGMSREAAQSVSETNLRSLQTLVNKSLLRRDIASGRFEIHELLRQYGEEYLRDNGLLDSIRAKHASYYADYMAKQEEAIKGQRQIAALKELDEEFDNVKAAWRYACQHKDEALIKQMLETLFWYCEMRHRHHDGMELFGLARNVWKDESAIAGAVLIRYPERSNDYTTIYERGLAIARKAGDNYEIAFALRQLGHWLSHDLEKAEGVTLMQESVAVLERMNEKYLRAVVLDDIGWSYRSSGQLDAQAQVVQQSIDLRRELNDKFGMANALRNMGGALGGMGSGAIEPLYKWQEALELSQEIGDKRNIAWNAYMLSIFWQFEGEIEKSKPYRQIAFELASEIREETVFACCLLSDALDLILQHEDYEQAKVLMKEAVPPNAPNDFRMIIYNVCQTFIAVAQPNENTMKSTALAMYYMGRDRGHPMVAMTIFLGAVRLMQQSQPELAAKWLGVGEKTPMYRMGRIWAWYQRYRAELVAHVGEAAFTVPDGTDIHQAMMETAHEAAAYLQAQA